MADLACPRCGGSLEGERFYGPCAKCRDDLGTTYDGTVSNKTAEYLKLHGDLSFEPKRVTTPNFVATKD